MPDRGSATRSPLTNQQKSEPQPTYPTLDCRVS